VAATASTAAAASIWERDSRRRAIEPRAPGLELTCSLPPAQPAALLDRIIDVARGKRRQVRTLAAGQRAVARPQLAPQQAHRSSVGDDVVHAGQERVLVLAEPDQDGAKQRPRLQIEWRARIGLDPPLKLGISLALVHPAQIDHRQLPAPRRLDAPHRAPRIRRERRTQGLVPRRDQLERRPQRLDVEPPVQPVRQR
jgi:hypothetical protein